MGKQQNKGHGKGAAPLARPAGGMAIAANWPIYEVLLSQGWAKEGALVTILSVAALGVGQIAAASFLVDLACLGVKSAAVKLYKTAPEYVQEMRARVLSTQPMAPAELDLVAKIIETGVAYAAQLGFKPDPVFPQARYLLDGADPSACPTSVPTGGPEGKPLFVAGPYDDPRRIIDQLLRTVGEGNFHYIMPVDPSLY